MWISDEFPDQTVIAVNPSQVRALKMRTHEEKKGEVTMVEQNPKWDIVAYLGEGISVTLKSCDTRDEALKHLRGYVSGGMK